MAEQPISGQQLKRLHTLWGMHWKVAGGEWPASVTSRFSGGADLSRCARLGWIAGVVDRQLESAKDLTRSEAIRVLDELAKLVPAHLVTKHRRPDRRTAKSYGTAGRKNTKGGKTIDLIDAPTWKLLNGLLEKLGWTREQLDAFVRSPHGPKRLVTLADANRVIWALKQMLRRENKRASEAQSHGDSIQSVAEVSP